MPYHVWLLASSGRSRSCVELSDRLILYCRSCRQDSQARRTAPMSDLVRPARPVARAFLVILLGEALALAVLRLAFGTTGAIALSIVLVMVTVALLALAYRRSGRTRGLAAEELGRREAEMRAIFDNMVQGVAMYDADYRLVAWNDRFRRYLEILEELVKQRLSLLSKKHVFERTRPNGTVLEVYRNPIPGGGFIAIYTDITERKRA